VSCERYGIADTGVTAWRGGYSFLLGLLCQRQATHRTCFAPAVEPPRDSCPVSVLSALQPPHPPSFFVIPLQPTLLLLLQLLLLLLLLLQSW
jgi:hypothetical protein